MGAFAYFPHTEEDIRRMLDKIGLKSLDELYSDVPAACFFKGEYELSPAMSEHEVREHFRDLASRNKKLKVFVGRGAYDHYTPSVVSYFSTRSEFQTSYTPYQCEISQGTLRYIFEWQTMICRLTGLDCSNASMYDGPPSAAEALRMCLSSVKKRNSVLLSGSLLPHVIETVKTYARYGDYEVVVAENVEETLVANPSEFAGVLVPSIDKFGQICDLGSLADKVHEAGALLVQYCDPSALAILKTPAEWGVDIAVGDGQALGIPLSYGGPYVGFIACREALMRKIPGRIVGQTVDANGQRSYVLTLQAREQHIRRERAASNICSNQSLVALCCTIYLSLMGPEGLRKVNELCWENSHYLHDRLLETGLFEKVHHGEFIKEFALKPLVPAEKLMKTLVDAGYFAALPVEDGLVSFCATEKHGKKEIDALIKVIKEAAL